MPHIRKVRRGQPLGLHAADWNALVDRFNMGQVGMRGHDAGNRHGNWVFAKNTSGSDRGRFECMSLGPPLVALADNGRADLIFDLDTADPDEPPAILVEPIADGRVGRVIIDGPAIAEVGGGSGDYATPDATNHRLAPGGGSIRLLASPHASDPKILPVLINGSGDNAILAKTPGGGIPAASGSGPYTFGSASCTPVNSDGTVGSGSVTVKNIVDQAIAGNVVIKAERVGSIYIVDVASCGS